MALPIVPSLISVVGFLHKLRERTKIKKLIEQIDKRNRYIFIDSTAMYFTIGYLNKYWKTTVARKMKLLLALSMQHFTRHSLLS